MRSAGLNPAKRPDSVQRDFVDTHLCFRAQQVVLCSFNGAIDVGENVRTPECGNSTEIMQALDRQRLIACNQEHVGFTSHEIRFELQHDTRTCAVDLGQAAQVEDDTRCVLLKRFLNPIGDRLACAEEQRSLQLDDKSSWRQIREAPVLARCATCGNEWNRSDSFAERSTGSCKARTAR